MSGGGGAEPPQPSLASSPPKRPRHQVHRSITELRRHHRGDQQHSSHHHHHHQHRREGSRDDRSSAAVVAPPPPPRGSLDVPRSGGITPSISLNPDASRSTSIMVPQTGGEDANASGVASAAPSAAEELRRVRATAAARATGLKKSLVDLTEFSTSTHQRLDDTYYGALEKLSVLRNTIVALKELAVLSAHMNEGLIKESQEVITDAQTQLDAFGQFNSQQQRIQALQDRIYDGRKKISRLSGRVDVVHKKIENWERADREWQERTRRRLKSLWIVMSILALVLLLLSIGARAYAPELEEADREVREEAVVKLGAEAGGGSWDGKHEKLPVSLSLSNGNTADKADEILRTLEEL